MQIAEIGYRIVMTKPFSLEHARLLFKEGIKKLQLAWLGENPIINLTESITLFTQARREGLIKNSQDYAGALMNEGNARARLAGFGVQPKKNLLKAIPLYNKSRREGFKKNTEHYAQSLMNEGTARENLAKICIDPIDYLKEAIILHERARSEGIIKGTVGYATSLVNEGNARRNLASLGVDSIDNIKEAIILHEKARSEGLIKGTVGYAVSLNNEGNARLSLGNLGVDVKNNLKKSISLLISARKKGLKKNTYMYAGILGNEGVARVSLARLGVDSIDNIKEAIILHEKARREGLIKNTPDYAIAYMNESNARVTLAGYGIETIENLRAVINLNKRARKEGLLKNTENYASTFINEMVARQKLAGLGIDPINNLKKSIKLIGVARKMGLTESTPKYANSLVNEGNARQTLATLGVEPIDNLKEAIMLHEKARIEGLIKNTPDYAKAYINEGNARIRLASKGIKPNDNYKIVIDLCKQARREGLIENTEVYAGAFSTEGHASQELAKLGVESINNKQKAESLFRSAKEILIKLNSKVRLVRIYRYLGDLKYLNDEMPEAYKFYKKGIQLVEELRSIMKIPEFRRQYYETVIYTYKNMVFTCLALNNVEEAFMYAELSKGRTFLELLASEKKKIKGDPKIVKLYQANELKIDEMERTCIKHNLSLIFNEELRKLKTNRNNLLLEIKQNNIEYYKIRTMEPIKIEKLKDILNKKTMIEYFLGKKLAIFTMKNELSVKIIDVDEQKVRKKVIELRKLINEIPNNQSKHTLKKVEEILKYFNNLLIEPIKELLDDEIVIIPHDILHVIPFLALKDDKYLVEKYNVSFAQSASSLEYTKVSSGDEILIVGNPTEDLEWAEKEAKKIAKIFQVQPILRNKATKNTIMKSMSNKLILHFSCHGYFDPINPAFSGIKLSDGVINAIDFMDMDLDTELTVLSACETALPEITKGDELEGLVRAIQYGGSRYVIASLWEVDDESTMNLFLSFYNEKGNYIDKLRGAVLTQLKKGYTIYHWAPFQIYGI